ncbi:hypothetical protein H2200_008954 [Cladophialophora chaetospira]|uniref:polynucleotide adenylyltransferase n=1 Tax=Cladophialophora chaetospira TaxID=386627 RepID=A0AA38X5B3_9EURO|nr:hypothetical protein H2200_008954 [Cladophialophora chaetospira]
MDSYRPGESYRPPTRESQLHRHETDTYRPRQRESPPPPWPPARRNNDMYHFQGSRGRSPPREVSYRPRPAYQNTRPPPTGPRQDYRRRPPVPGVRTAANRPLFNFRPDEATNSSAAGLGGDAKFKFRNLDELTDSEEEEMLQSEDEKDDYHVNKRIRLSRTESGLAPTLPKWSNPDPYTSLPPVGDVIAKRTDVVKLIRKARVDTDPSLQKGKQPDDFISFNDASDHESLDMSAVPPRPSISPSPSPPRPPPPSSIALRIEPANMVTGKRKRGPDIGDEGRRSRKDKQGYADNRVKVEWMAPYGTSPTPWLRSHPSSNSAGVVLHKEIIDFYEWVKPKPYEQEVRNSVFQRLSRVLQGHTPGELKAFGSYAAGLYLPTADMDLVYLTQNYQPGLFTQPSTKKWIFSVSAYLGRMGIADGPIVRIPQAKVPIIKFVDRISGLKIDLSFDNDTGVVAIDTFHKWKMEHPIMPIIVSVIKQYLMIRGWNDVSTGGLGGFSTICLVTSLLQHLPITQRPANLGDILVEFFNFYGNVFDRKSTVLRLDPPAYLNKANHPARFNDKSNERLTIIDPHRSDNNISGGTNQIHLIFDSFSKAHEALVTRLSAHESGATEDQPGTFLGCLIGGSFASYEAQRATLRALSVNADVRPVGDRSGRRNNAPAQSVEVDRRANRNGEPIANDNSCDRTSTGKQPKEANRGVRRGARLKVLRPELAASIRNSLSQVDAIKLGGYKTGKEMAIDLDAREAAAAKLARARSNGQAMSHQTSIREFISSIE